MLSIKGDGTIDYIFSFEIPVLSIEIKLIYVFSQACIEGYNLKETCSCTNILCSVSVLYGYLCYFQVKLKKWCKMINDRDFTPLKSKDCVINRKYNVFNVDYISLVRNIPFQKSKHWISSKYSFLITRLGVKVFLYVENILQSLWLVFQNLGA